MPDQEAAIEELKFRGNKIESIENGTFDKFTSLKKLTISDNALTNITEGILTPELGSTLEELDLSDNKLANLSASTFQNMKKLKSLNLNGNENAISSSLQFPIALENLESLSLERCEISKLPDFTNMK